MFLTIECLYKYDCHPCDQHRALRSVLRSCLKTLLSILHVDILQTGLEPGHPCPIARDTRYSAELPWRGFRVLNTSNLFPLHHIMVIYIHGLNRFPLFVWSFVKSPTNDLGSRVRLQLFVTRKVNTNKVLNSDCHKKELVKLC